MKNTLKNDFLSSRVRYIPLEHIVPNPHQPRRDFDPAALAELADSIRQYGVLQPATVRTRGRDYELVAGERRFRAAKLAGLKELPCLIAQVGEEDSALLALMENLQRRDLNYMEEAAAIAQLVQRWGLSQEEAARKLGKSQSAVANKLRLLRLPGTVVELLQQGDLSERHARALVPLSPALQEKAADTILKSDLSVRQTELLVKKLTAQEKAQPAVTTGGLEVNYAEEAAKSLGAHLGRGCKIVSGRKKGRIELEYYGVDDLNNLLDALNTLTLK